MGLIQAFTGALGGTLADQWKDIIQPTSFDEHTVVAPGEKRSTNKGRGTNYKGSEGIITNGSLIYVPENTAAFIFSQQGIEDVITDPGGYEYKDGEPGIFSGDGLVKSIFSQTAERVRFGGIPAANKNVAYVNKREIRNIKFGTKGPQVYNDKFYGVDLEVTAFGVFSIQVVDVLKFVRNFVPPGVFMYSFNSPPVREQIIGEFLQSFIVALNKLSDEYRVSKIQSHGNELAEAIIADESNAGTWPERFGFKVVGVGIQNIQMSEDSKELVKNYASTKMGVSAYEDVSKQASDISAQQKIAGGIEEHGLGEGAGLIFGMNMGQALSPNGDLNGVTSNSEQPQMTVDEQIEAVKKLKELLDEGILTQEEFDKKKKEIMGV